MIRILSIVSKLDLPDWWIGAGFIRNKIFDYLHDYKKRTKLNDVYIIYFNKKDLSEQTENNLQEKLRSIEKTVNWFVTNQARRSKFNNDKPYKSFIDGLSHWNETATCIGVKIHGNRLALTAPHGIKDLVNLVIRINPLSAHRDFDYFKRLKKMEK